MEQTTPMIRTATSASAGDAEAASPAPSLAALDVYWRAAKYLSVGQDHLPDDPLLREPLRAEHVKPRLLRHWGTTPGLNLLYAHMNRVIRDGDPSALFVTEPGRGGPFTGGVGEGSVVVRAHAADSHTFLGVGIDEVRNTTHEEEVTAPGAPVRTFVVAAREDLAIARDTRTALTREAR